MYAGLGILVPGPGGQGTASGAIDKLAVRVSTSWVVLCLCTQPTYLSLHAFFTVDSSI